MSKSASFDLGKQNCHLSAWSWKNREAGVFRTLVPAELDGGGENQEDAFGVEKRKATKRVHGPKASEEAIP